MDKVETFQEFLATQNAQLPLPIFVLNLLLTVALAGLLALVYVRFGTSPTNRHRFAQTFIPVAATTMLIISLVKTSLALSLGLVGALSIVRFRAAIKEPEELTFLFLSIAAGLGFGANHRALTLVGFGIIVALIVLRALPNHARSRQEMVLTVTTPGSGPLTMERMVEVLKKHCDRVTMRRFEEGPGPREALFAVEFVDISRFDGARAALRAVDSEAQLVFVDGTGSYHT